MLGAALPTVAGYLIGVGQGGSLEYASRLARAVRTGFAYNTVDYRSGLRRSNHLFRAAPSDGRPFAAYRALTGKRHPREATFFAYPGEIRRWWSCRPRWRALLPLRTARRSLARRHSCGSRPFSPTLTLKIPGERRPCVQWRRSRRESRHLLTFMGGHLISRATSRRILWCRRCSAISPACRRFFRHGNAR